MRSSEFEDEAENIKFIKFELEKLLRALSKRYNKRLKIDKNKQRIAKQQIKNNKIRALRNDTATGVRKLERPKR